MPISVKSTDIGYVQYPHSNIINHNGNVQINMIFMHSYELCKLLILNYIEMNIFHSILPKYVM